MIDMGPNVNEIFQNLEALIESKFPGRYKFETKPFSVEERENVGLTLRVKFAWYKAMDIDIAHSPQDYEHNCFHSYDGEELAELAKSYLKSLEIPFEL
ncbi:hypothetical protein KY311_02340 [Candidatus Woesearchaeota archaeon]|nr:hypothetical protein [Candidatus Woesearchaeota archaeon]